MTIEAALDKHRGIVNGEPVAVSFTETMKGFVDFGEASDYEAGYENGRDKGTSLDFTLTISHDDIELFKVDPQHRGRATGVVRCSELGGELEVQRGDFNLFVDLDQVEDVRNMRYRLLFCDEVGRPLTLIGHKVVRATGVTKVWRDTTTLFTKILNGHVEPSDDEQATVLATGILRIIGRDFAKQLTTFRAKGGGLAKNVGALATFGTRFVGTLKEVYVPRSRRQEVPARQRHDIATYTTEGVANAEITTVPLTTGDNVGLTMTRFTSAPCQDAILLLHGLTTSTDMFIMPEHVNLVSHLLDDGYTDVWSLDWRGSNRHKYNLTPNRYNLDDVALYDIPAAVAEVRRTLGNDARIHVIAHCVGSLTVMMSLSAGLIDGISSVVVNSVGLTPRVPRWSRVKLATAPHLVTWTIRYPIVDRKWSYPAGPRLRPGKLLAKAVSLGHRECDEPACHMVSFMYGTGRPGAYRHENLSDVTHRRLGDLFGAVTANYYHHMHKMTKRGVAVAMNPTDPRYASLPRNYMNRVAELDLPPILFVTGNHNRVFTDSNIVCYEALNRLDPGNANELAIFEGYGHQDVFMGMNCDRDTFPRFTEFIGRHRSWETQ
jgi:cholesterol oxidase